jgi:YidC/Oxa1 family membrane protein insertase
MERRVFIAICLSILVMYLYQVYFVPPPPARDVSTAEPSGAAPSPAVPPAPVQEAAAQEVSPAPETLISEAAERGIVVTTNKFEIELSNRGGHVRHLRLRDYLDREGQLVDLVPASAPTDSKRPFMLEVEDPQLTRRLNDSVYRTTGAAGGRVDATNKPVVVVFEYQDAAGLHARKEFRFEPDSYLVTFDARVLNGQQTLNPLVHWGPGLGDVGASTAGGSFFTGNYVQPPGAIYHQDGDVERVTAGAVAEAPSVEGAFLFAGIDDHYFIVAAVDPGPARLEYEALSSGSAEARLQFVSFAARFADGPQQVRYFVGPKEIETLRDVHPQLVYSINFGVFQWLVVPLLQALKWLYGYIGNYGWAIIVLTVLINLVMFPLRHKSLVSMRKMQLIQPQVKAIQERYANLKITDPARQKMNTEVMNLYREKGANPAAGCVPMLLTMPVLFAFYSMLSQAIELRGADFGFWIHDLSQKDPYFVTPLLMGVTMFWQQWMAPTSTDQMQQRMMLIMPVVFTALFLGFPSGLAIYYLVSNVFQIGQQYFTRRVIGPPPAAQPPRPVAERKLKKTKAG